MLPNNKNGNKLQKKKREQKQIVLYCEYTLFYEINFSGYRKQNS